MSDGYVSARQRLLRANDAEFVAFRISEHCPRLVASLTDIDGSCPEGDEALDLRLAFAGADVEARVEIEMHPVLHNLLVGAGHEADADGSIVGRTDDDLPLAFGQDGPAEHLAPEPGQSGKIAGIDDDVVEGYRHSLILLHRCPAARTSHSHWRYRTVGAVRGVGPISEGGEAAGSSVVVVELRRIGKSRH